MKYIRVFIPLIKNIYPLHIWMSFSILFYIDDPGEYPLYPLRW